MGTAQESQTKMVSSLGEGVTALRDTGSFDAIIEAIARSGERVRKAEV